MHHPSRTSVPAFDLAETRADILGAQPDANGTNFALFSEHATRVELCLFDATGTRELHRLPLPEMEGGVWHGYLPGVGEGQVYGYRVHGPFAPEQGHRFNANKLLLDPYARSLVGAVDWTPALFGHDVARDDLTFDPRDSAPFMPKGVVVSNDFDWDVDRALRHRWEDTVIYEAHVKGLTMRHPGVARADRGTFAGLASDAVIDHLTRIGVTAIELLPVHAFPDDQFLVDKGLTNYWGYSTLSFFAPQSRYLKTGHLSEIKRAIRRFHKAGIEVILDVVYNHTCEGSERGPTLSFRGIDNAVYYLNSPENPRYAFDTTGTGNTLNVAHPMVLRMVLDSLRYWVETFHVDGFRFDLASTLGREATGFEREGAFFAAMRQDPVLSTVKLIAEPWDIGDGGYQVGGFPWPFREWNDKARDDLRAFWRRDEGLLPRVAERLTGSPVQFDHSHRPATSSVNFLSAHDGFTLWDTVSYNDKHNAANGEDGRDGHNHNLSDNMGVEGATDDPQVNAARERRVRSMLATLFLSQGVPMILAGDEFGQTQGGNNNAYCQDNETTWLNWAAARPGLTDAVAALTAFRRKHPRFVRARFPRGDDAQGVNQTTWRHPEGREMTAEDWQQPGLAIVGMCVAVDDGPRVCVVLNAGDAGHFDLGKGRWRRVIDTSRSDGIAAPAPRTESGAVPIDWQTVAVFERV